MADIFVQLGPMSYSKDTTKVAVKYATNAQKIIKDAAAGVITKTPGFTLVQGDNKVGFIVNLTLAEVKFETIQGMPGVKAYLTGTVSSFPKDQMISQSLSGSGGFGGSTTDGDVRDAIKMATEITMSKSVLPTLKNLPLPPVP